MPETHAEHPGGEQTMTRLQERGLAPEKEDTIGRILQQGAELENELIHAPVDLKLSAVAQLKRTVDASGTSEAERAFIPELSSAVRELDAVHRDAIRAAREAQRNLASLFARIKKLGRFIAGAATLMGALSFTEGCATIGARDTQRFEQKEIKPGRSTPEQVRQDAINQLRANAHLREEIGEQNVEAFVRAIGRWDERRINNAIADLAGVDISQIEQEGVLEIRVLSDAELAEERKKDESLGGHMNAVTQNDRIWIRASAFRKPDGSIDEAKVLPTLIHEKNHAATTDSTKKLFGQEQRKWDMQGVSTDMNEGVTELLALRIMERLGEKPLDQGYAGGNFAAAYFLERIVGTKALAEDYYHGTTVQISGKIKEKLGTRAVKDILREHFPIMEKIFASRPDAISAAFDIITHCKAAGIDYQQFIEQANRDGIKEEYRFFEKGDGLAIIKEVDGQLVVANGVVEDAESLVEGSPPLRIHVWTAGSGLEFSKVGNAAKNIIETIKKIEEMRVQIIRDAGLGTGWEKDRQTKREVDDTVAIQREAYGVDAAFNIVVNISPELMELRQQHKNATGKFEKQEIARRASKEVERLAREALADIREEVKRELGK